MRSLYFLGLVLITFQMANTASAEVKAKAKAKKKTEKAYQLTEHEKKIVKDAQATFKKAEKLPPPSEHMQKKMQSGLAD